MSIAAIDKVIKTSNQSGSQFTALIMIADYAEDDGCNAHPTYPTLAAKCRFGTIRWTIRVVDQLIEAGEIVKHVGKGTRTGRGSDGNAYDIVFQDGSNWTEINERCKQFGTPLPPKPTVCYSLVEARAKLKGGVTDTLKGGVTDTLKGGVTDTQSPSVESVNMNPHVFVKNSEDSTSELDAAFPRPADSEPSTNGQKQQSKADPLTNVFHARMIANEKKSQNPRDSDAYKRLAHHLPADQAERLINGVGWCEDNNLFQDDHAVLAAAFIIITDMTFIGLDNDNKRGADMRKMWRQEFDLLLKDYSVADCISFYYYAVKEMKEADLAIKGPRSLEANLNKVISIINQRGHYE